MSFRQSVSLLITYLGPVRARVVLLTLVLFGSIGLQLANPQIVRHYIDTVISNGSVPVLVTAALLFLGVAAGQQALSVFTTSLSEDIGGRATNLLRMDLVQHCLSLDMSFHGAHPPGEMIDRIDGDVSARATFFPQLMVQVLGSIVLLVGVLCLLYLVDWRVGLAMGVLCVLTHLSLLGMRGKSTPYFVRFQRASADLSSFWPAILTATEDIRSSGARGYALRRHAQLLGSQLSAIRAASLMGSIPIQMMTGSVALANALSLALGVYLLRQHEITVGTVHLTFNYTQLLLLPLQRITDQLQGFQKAAASLIRVNEFLSVRPAVPDTGKAIPPPGALSVDIDGASFGYGGAHLALQDISIHLKPGVALGVIGKTGSGKTTLARLLFRLYDPLQKRCPWAGWIVGR